MDIEAIKAVVLPFLQALASGGLAGLLGYMKMEELGTGWKVIFTKKFWEVFKPTKAIKTILVSMIVYGIAYYFGWTPEFVEGLTIMTLIVYGVDALVKFIVRRTPLVKVWNWLKTKFFVVYP